MALYGLLADIHGNREALEAALAALERRGVERLACLGDIVGYNADPDECVAALRARGALAIAGNHDLIATGRLDFARCSDKARYSLARTRRRLSPEAARYLAALPAQRLLEERVLLVHGGVRDVEQYLVGAAQIAENAAYLRAAHPAVRLCFFGHSHAQKAYEVNEVDEVDEAGVRELAPSRELALDPAKLTFVNPGSVDASRKSGRRLAEFAVLDTARWRLELHAVPYDCAATEAKAAVFGYRMPPWVGTLYTLERKFGVRARSRPAR